MTATDPAVRYEQFVQVLAVVKRAGVERLGFEGWREMGLLIAARHAELVSASTRDDPMKAER